MADGKIQFLQLKIQMILSIEVCFFQKILHPSYPVSRIELSNICGIWALTLQQNRTLAMKKIHR